MSRRVGVAVAVVALALCCCLLHASSDADTSPSPGLRVVQQETEEQASIGANDQLQPVVAGEADEEVAAAGVSGRMDLELEDYPGSGANDRHSPWWQQRRN